MVERRRAFAGPPEDFFGNSSVRGEQEGGARVRFQSEVIVDSPWMTEQEAARYVRAGVDRLRSWVDRGFVTASRDPDGRVHYHRVQLDGAMDFSRRASASETNATVERDVPAVEPDHAPADRVARPAERGAPTPPAPPPAATWTAAELPYTPPRTVPTRATARTVPSPKPEKKPR